MKTFSYTNVNAFHFFMLLVQSTKQYYSLCSERFFLQDVQIQKVFKSILLFSDQAMLKKATFFSAQNKRKLSMY